MTTTRQRVLRAAKTLGLFAAARLLMRRRLRILCYHGYAAADETSFRPQLFIRPETFRARLKLLRDRGYRVLGLGEALEALAAGTLPNDAVVLTIDDGFRNVHALAFPILREFRVPCTVYVTTYYMQKGNPVFRLAAQYLFWKAGRPSVRPEAVGLPPRPDGAEASMWDVIRHGEALEGDAARVDLVRALGRALGQDADALARSRILSLMTPAEVLELHRGGVDIQLHTHRHRLPRSAAEVAREIGENRSALEAAGVPRADHFCYPSGIWHREQWPWLDAAGVKSSTTCEPGLVTAGLPRHGLPRFLDSESISQIEFEAEVCGFLELLRMVTGKTRRIAGKVSNEG